MQNLFLWRLNIEKPKIIKIGLDTMVLDNDDSQKKEGVEPSYKKVKGFQPLQLFWGRYMIDAIFRNGKAHSNHGNHVRRGVTRTVQLIREHYREISSQAIINDYHMRARYELVNRALKDFGTEHLPFKRFTSNAAYYYLMTIAFFIFVAFKKDAGSSAVEITWYAQTFRRKFLDFAGQIVHSGRRIKMKINAALIERLDFSRIWENSVSAPPIALLGIR